MQSIDSKGFEVVDPLIMALLFAGLIGLMALPERPGTRCGGREDGQEQPSSLAQDPWCWQCALS